MSTDDTRTRILLAAGPVFAEKGYQAATVRDICQSAGVNVASVNYHFGDKEGLYLETVTAARKMRAEQVPLPIWSADTPTETKLTDYIRTLLTRMVALQEAPWQVRLMMREVLQPTSACRELVQDYFRPQFELLLSILDEVLPADTPRPRREQIAFSVIAQCFFYRVAGDVIRLVVDDAQFAEHYSLDRLAAHIARMCLAALGLSPPLVAPRRKSNPRLQPERIAL